MTSVFEKKIVLKKFFWGGERVLSIVIKGRNRVLNRGKRQKCL